MEALSNLEFADLRKNMLTSMCVRDEQKRRDKRNKRFAIQFFCLDLLAYFRAQGSTASI